MASRSAGKTDLDPEVSSFLKSNPQLCLGGGNLLQERRIHAEVLGFTNQPESLQSRIGHVEFTGIRGPQGIINLRVLYPTTPLQDPKSGLVPALIYFHGGGYTVGSGDEFENGCCILAEKAGLQVYLVDYRLAPEWSYPTQLDEYEYVIDWLRGSGGKERSVDPDLVFGAGDSAGGNMTSGVSLRRRDAGRAQMAGIFLLYPEARLPFDTSAATENNAGPYLSCE